MNCERARDLLLEADPAALRAPRGGELGLHLSECSACSAAADRVLEVMTLLDAELARSPRRPVGAALDQARRRRTPSRRLAPWLAPLAAAAVLAALLLSRVPEPVPPMPVAAVPAPGARLPVVENAGSADIAVFATRDPYITIVWIYKERSP